MDSNTKLTRSEIENWMQGARIGIIQDTEMLQATIGVLLEGGLDLFTAKQIIDLKNVRMILKGVEAMADSIPAEPPADLAAARKRLDVLTSCVTALDGAIAALDDVAEAMDAKRDESGTIHVTGKFNPKSVKK